MLYKRLERKRRVRPGGDDKDFMDSRASKVKYRGGRFTALSFLAMGICLLFIKITNPDADMRTPVLMLVTVGLACIVLTYISRRMK
jgi:hypothetical protein